MASDSVVLEKAVRALYGISNQETDIREVNSIFSDLKKLEKNDPAAVAKYEGASFTVPLAMALAMDTRGWCLYRKLLDEVEVLTAQKDASSDEESKKNYARKINSAWTVQTPSIIGDWNRSLKYHEMAATHYALANIYFVLNKQGKKALAHIQRAVQLDSKDSDYQELLRKIEPWAQSFKGSFKLLLGLGAFSILALIMGFSKLDWSMIFTGIVFSALTVGYFMWKKQ